MGENDITIEILKTIREEARETKRALEERFKGMDQRFDGMDQRFDGVEERLALTNAGQTAPALRR